MSNFILSSDSCCDMTPDECESRGISRLAMEYIADRDGKIEPTRDYFSKKEDYVNFYKQLAEGVIVKTTQLTLAEQIAYFEKILMREKKDIVHLTLSSGLSGTYDQAVLAAKMLAEKDMEHRVYVVDSLSATAGQRLLVDEGEKLRDAGLSAAEAKDKLDEIKMHIHHWLIVDDLNHLKRGGRISGVAAAIGTILNLKPFIGINHEGRLVVLSKNKGTKKSIAKVLEMIKKHGGDMTGKTVYVLMTSSEENSCALRDAIMEHCKAEVKVVNLGPVIGAHTGPGAFAAAFIGKERIRDLA